MMKPKLSIGLFMLAVSGLSFAGVITQPVLAQDASKDKSLGPTHRVVLNLQGPDSNPVADATLYGFAQFSSAKPNWFRQSFESAGDPGPLTSDGDGQLVLRFALPELKPTSYWIISADEKLGAFVSKEDLETKNEITVQLEPTIKLHASFANPQADSYGIPFLHRGYLYLKNGHRVAQFVGQRAEIVVPQGEYEMMGYNGNPNSLLADVPKFRVAFHTENDNVALPKVVSGQVDVERENKVPDGMVNLGEFYYGVGEVTLEPNTLETSYLGEHPFSIAFEGIDGKPYRGNEVFVVDLDQRNTFLYYGQFPEDGVLNLGTVKEGKYRVIVDGHSTAECRKIELGEDKETANKTMMPPMPGYPLKSLHILNPKSLEKESLAQFDGKVVYIEFWASWCGPCMQAMNHVESVVADKKESWGDRVSLVAVNINENPQEVIDTYSKRFGWKSFTHLYGGDKDANDWDAPILKQLQANGIPLAIILGPDGTMIWRGHPESIDVDRKIESALQKAEK